MRCEHCREPLDPEARSHARFCSPAHRVAAHRTKRRREDEARRADLEYAQAWLRRQTEAVREGDAEALAALTAEADEYLASLG